MVGSRERIEQDLAALDESLTAFDLEFRSTYESYLTALGQAVRQQLILASYHLCTQVMPDAFLKLSFNERQKMQHSVRLLAAISQEKLRSLATQEQAVETIEEDLEEDLEEDDDDDEIEEYDEMAEYENRQEDDNIDDNRDIEEQEDSIIHYQFPAKNHELPLPTNSPETLARWQRHLEKAIFNIIKLLSRDTNRLLQQSGILPNQLPQQILEAAYQAESSGESVAGPPNLLNIIIETGTSSKSGKLGETRGNTAIQITAIKLRLSEIEFADAATSAGRQQIRNLSMRLNTLGRDYQKKQRELAVVQAESAWRSSWFED
ncbi:hypothetical protein CP500_012395 [Tychonema bourrellyi FEM_GT703]|uniref:Primosomal protein n=1 Tax=Tychonema bourrellyi FEM_GT703 TaxID=2040638 RepID=A0A2G4F094_9CYAN|nr:hypothetical protein [Tychonema bourrellyi]PHX55176.1 hypothetical protein CP500_012395 [Tychonema bourrellyi FEM_GT703]